MAEESPISKGKGTGTHTKRKKIAIAAVCAAALFSAASYAAGKAAYEKADEKLEQTVGSMQEVQKEEVKELINENIKEEALPEMRDSWLIAAFGLDTRDGSLERGNSDVIMLVSVNGDTGEVNLASVYRDTLLKTGESSYRKANYAYQAGGPLQAVRMLNENLDLEIDDYAAANWGTVAKAINLLEGVDVDVTKAEFRYINAYITETVKSTGIGSVQLKETGMQHLDGVQAVAYCRLRYPDSDFERTERQREVLKQLLEKARGADFALLNQLAVEIFPEMASSIEKEDIYNLIWNIGKIHLGNTGGFPEENYLRTINGGSYVIPNTLSSCVTGLHGLLFGTDDYEPTEAVEEISAKITAKASNTGIKAAKAENVEEKTENIEENADTEETNIEEMKDDDADAGEIPVPDYAIIGGNTDGPGPGKTTTKTGNEETEAIIIQDTEEQADPG